MAGESESPTRSFVLTVLIVGVVVWQSLAMTPSARAHIGDVNGPHPSRVGNGPGQITEWASNHIVALHETIRIAIKNDPIPSAGRYFHGGPLSGQTLHFHPRIGITVVRWSDFSLSDWLQTGGTFQERDSPLSASRSFQVLPIEAFDDAVVLHPRGGVMPASPTMIVMRWDNAWVMVEEMHMHDFIADLNDWHGIVASGERRSDRDWLNTVDTAFFCLRSGLEEPESELDLPEEYAALVCREPLHAEVLATAGEAQPEDPSPWLRGKSWGRVAIYGEGLHPGMTFSYGWATHSQGELRIERVVGPFAEGRYESKYTGRAAVEPRVGQTVSTWRSDPAVSESRERIARERLEGKVLNPRPGVRSAPVLPARD